MCLAVLVAELALPAQSTAPSAATLFYLTLLFVFVTAILTTVVTKWSRDKCLKFFHGYHVTLERNRGQTTWGRLKVFPTGVEIVYDHPFVDVRGRKKTSSILYQQDVEQQLLSLLRYHHELSPREQARRQRQIQWSFNPGPLRRFWRAVRNFVNTLRDAFNAAIGAVVGQYKMLNPGSALLASQSQHVTAIGQTLLGKFANAYEPLLEQYVGQPVILDVADPLDPNNASVQYAGYLADYTQQFIAVFSVNHESSERASLTLPDAEAGERLPPTPPPPAPGAPPPPPLPALKIEHGLAVRLDGPRVKVQNTRPEPVVVRRLDRPGFEPLELGAIVPPSGTLDLPARDARGGTLDIEIARCLDVVAPRKFATVRHAGQLVERRGIMDELYLNQLPLVPKLFGRDGQKANGQPGFRSGDESAKSQPRSGERR